MSKRILITGATGFVGSHILETLMKDKSLNLIASCRKPDNLNGQFTGEVRVGDLRDDSYIDKLVEDVDVICHAAAWTSLWGYRKKSYENFLKPSLNLIDTAKQSGVRQFIFPSSTSAAAPDNSEDAMNKGIPREFWPHLKNVIAIENKLQEVSDDKFTSIVLRLGIFTGRRYNLGLFPILLPRLKTHLVPWVAGGKTHIPLIDGRDIGRAFLQSINADILNNHERFNIVGKEQPTFREIVNYVNQEFNYPKPHFGVPFFIAYPFAWLMEKINPIVPWEPLVTRSIIHLLEETHTSNDKAKQQLDFQPEIDWRVSVKEQIQELKLRQDAAMSMAVKE
ncbi:MAG: NAD(P)-dependent oxidoreductase [Bacteroidota bacterium]